MQIEVTPLLNGATISGRSQVKEAYGENTTFDIVITGVASVLVQASNNKACLDDASSVTWHTLATVTASGPFSCNDPWKYFSVNPTITSGSVTVLMGNTE